MDIFWNNRTRSRYMYMDFGPWPPSWGGQSPSWGGVPLRTERVSRTGTQPVAVTRCMTEPEAEALNYLNYLWWRPVSQKTCRGPVDRSDPWSWKSHVPPLMGLKFNSGTEVQTYCFSASSGHWVWTWIYSGKMPQALSSIRRKAIPRIY